ncbi:leucyl aminopeptidase [Hazenella sp. IB182353]|uniref:leucyl aminopeptidase n=1 Tax=Polycladospora coralii TaxID=2771432 RepID=UPI001747864A|nr:leucyl aminopeptidase [Polycladospora coralii]MBS7530245.1 leucyl aminopeptidase [Polycladospora coralii]
MEWRRTETPIEQTAVDAIILFQTEEKEGVSEFVKKVDEAIEHRISVLISEGEITGKYCELTAIHNWGKIPAKRAIVLGLGAEEKISLDRLKNVVATAARYAKKKGLKQLALGCPTWLSERFTAVDVIQSLVEGMELGVYQHPSYKQKEESSKQIESIWLSLQDVSDSAVKTGIERGKVYAHATNYARMLTHEPANFLTPHKMVQHARQIAEKRGLSIEVLNKEKLQELGMGGLLAVSQGSSQEPYMIALTYKGAPESAETLGYVGKGLTFDNGGLQIKPANYMYGMNEDMGGAAAVLGAMDAIGALKPHTNVVAVIPTCENAINGEAFRPGDVITSYSGKTIEIHHTDAEGRVVLADGITYAKRLGATKLVDIATLTGAVIIALGHESAGLMSNDSAFGQAVKKAAHVAGERVWELPMYEEYEEHIKSDIADVKNDDGSKAGTIQGGLFLREFADGTPWVHLDIAGSGEAMREKGIHVKGATGAGTRTLIQLAMV